MQNSTDIVRVPSTLSFNGHTIRVEGEMTCLTDMWKANGSDPSQRPTEWARIQATVQFVEFLEETMVGNTHHESFRVVRDGGNVATFAHWQIALAYAKYLSPAFHAWCNTVVRDHMSGTLKPISHNDLEERKLEMAERRLALQIERGSTSLRRDQAKYLGIAAKGLRDAGRTDIALAFDVKAAEVLLGESLNHALPPAQHHDWKSPSDMAKQFGVTPNRIGLIITALGIRGDNPGIARPIINKSNTSSREVTTYLYSPKAVEMIREKVESLEVVQGGAE